MDLEVICRNAVCEVLGYTPPEVKDDLALDDLDSLNALEVLIAIEEETNLYDLGDDVPPTFGALEAMVRQAAAVQA